MQGTNHANLKFDLNPCSNSNTGLTYVARKRHIVFLFKLNRPITQMNKSTHMQEIVSTFA